MRDIVCVMKISRLTVLNEYKRINSAYTTQKLGDVERKFLAFCDGHHDLICNKSTKDDNPIIVRAAMFLF